MYPSGLDTVAIALVVLSVVVPTGAALGDEVWRDEGIVLSPHAGPNGRYASLDGDGDLTVQLGDDLNPDAITTYDGVFDLSNAGSHDVRVWITHDATAFVTFRTDDSGSIQGEANATVLSPGETLVVDVVVDTYGTAAGQDLVDEIAVHATRTDQPNAPRRDEPVGVREPDEDTITVSGSVRIDFDRPVGDEELVSVASETALPPASSSFGVRPVIARTNPGFVVADPRRPRNERLAELGVDGVAAPGELVVLSGTETVVDSPGAIYPDGEAVAVYDVTGPRRLANASATIWLAGNRSRFGSVDPSEARVARQLPEGWHLLETKLVHANATHVVVQARTPGIARFAVLPRNELGYRWSIDERGQFRSEDVAVRFDDPGIYTARLAVTDGLGRRNETAYRLLVNDRPAVRVEAPEDVEPGEPVTLRSVVTDKYGETTVVWRFDDGSVVRGRTVNRSFEAGEHVVRVRVEDEFGANSTVETRVVAGARNPALEVVEFALGAEGRLALLALVGLVVVAVVRWLVDRLGVDRRRRER